MATLTPATLETFRPVTWTDTRNATFSQALEAGHTHCGWLIGPTTDLFGQAVALASHSVPPAKAQEQTTRDTFGPLFGGSSPSADLQSSLANRLRRRLGVDGSTEYDLIWKSWDMSAGEPICALRASTRRTSGNGYGGWPKTPQASGEGGVMEIREGENGKYKLRDYAQTAGWPTMTVDDSKSQFNRISNGKPRALNLNSLVMLTGANPSGGLAETGSGDECPAGWSTPQAADPVEGARTVPDSNQKCLGRDLHLMAGYPTPRTVTGGAESAERKKELGRQESGGGDLQSIAECYRLPDMTGWKLNPLFSLWLMGYPAEWAYCVVPETQSCRDWPQIS